MKVIIPLILLVVQFILSICFQNLEGSLFGYHIRTIALVAGALGQLLSLYLLSMLVLYLVEKIQTRNGKRLIVGCFILLFALLWRFSLVDKAKMETSRYDKTASTAQRNAESEKSPYDKRASSAQREKELEKAFFEASFAESAKASAQVVERLNLQHLDNEISSETTLAKALLKRQKTLSEVSREKFYKELIKAEEEASNRACEKVKEKYKDLDCSKYITAEEREKANQDHKKIAELFYDYKEAEFAFAKFILDHYDNFTFSADGEIEDVAFDTETQRLKFVRLANDASEKMDKLQSLANKYTKEIEKRGWM